MPPTSLSSAENARIRSILNTLLYIDSLFHHLVCIWIRLMSNLTVHHGVHHGKPFLDETSKTIAWYRQQHCGMFASNIRAPQNPNWYQGYLVKCLTDMIKVLRQELASEQINEDSKRQMDVLTALMQRTAEKAFEILGQGQTTKNYGMATRTMRGYMRLRAKLDQCGTGLQSR